MQNKRTTRPLWINILIWTALAVVGIVALVLLIQLIPYGKAHVNPPVVAEPNWDSPQTRALAKQACFDCHSNETIWPWYSSVAPMSWLIQHDVDDGREHLNFSEWGVSRSGRQERETDEMGEVILEGEMPPAQYLLIHPEAKLSESEKQALAEGLTTTLRR